MVIVAAAVMVPIVEVTTLRRIARLMIVVEETKEELLRSEDRALLDLPAARVPVAAAGAKLHHRHPRSCGSHPNRILLDVNIDGKSSL